ncbi:uncharacterized protein LOC134338787 [Mobula hypostoma]|uniref:uncharacterized protein LOC134338787 n=1 Tax=Mobula hypostoma TaxID=723540 RepID=UPI002FC38791
MLGVVKSRDLQSSRRCRMFQQKSEFTNSVVILGIIFYQIYTVSSGGQYNLTIRLNPILQAIVKGENITVECSIAPSCSDGWFYLHKTGRNNYEDKSRAFDGQCTVSFEIPRNLSENYTCGYVARQSGGWTRLRSDPIFVLVTDRPKTPEIDLNNQYEKFVTGETVEITCKLSVNYSCSSMHLLRNGELLFNQTTVTSYHYRSCSFQIIANATGYYSCRCALYVSGEWLLSEPSDSLNITVINQPTKPIIARNQTEKVLIKGELLQLTCAVDFQANSTTYHWYNSSHEIHLIKSDVTNDRHLATFQIAPDRTDYYTCVSGIYVSGQWRFSEESERVNVTILDHPRQPEISVNFTGNAFIQGEIVRVTCKSAYPHRVHKFLLYESRHGRLLGNMNIDIGLNLATIDLLPNETEIYFCAYQVTISGRFVDSKNSTRLQVHVIKPLMKAEIYLKRNFSIYIGGETLSLACKAPDQDTNGTFYVYNVNSTFPAAADRIMKGSNSVTFNITTMMKSGEESYQCMYKASVAGRVIESERSRPLFITVKERPPKPTIVIEREGPLTEEGLNVTLNCTAPDMYAANVFHLYINSEGQTHEYTEAEGGHSATFTLMVPPLKMSETYYTCKYEVKVAERSIYSDLSNPLALSTSGNGHFPWKKAQHHLSMQWSSRNTARLSKLFNMNMTQSHLVKWTLGRMRFR